MNIGLFSCSFFFGGMLCLLFASFFFFFFLNKVLKSLIQKLKIYRLKEIPGIFLIMKYVFLFLLIVLFQVKKYKNTCVFLTGLQLQELC